MEAPFLSRRSRTGSRSRTVRVSVTPTRQMSAAVATSSSSAGMRVFRNRSAGTSPLRFAASCSMRHPASSDWCRVASPETASSARTAKVVALTTWLPTTVRTLSRAIQSASITVTYSSTLCPRRRSSPTRRSSPALLTSAGGRSLRWSLSRSESEDMPRFWHKPPRKDLVKTAQPSPAGVRCCSPTSAIAGAG